ncbi:MAG TPA: carbohydrate porin [Gammaproteobacteria bacterium]|nr:carbohydrate porin [Gammaproteobacteria bacterium]
MLKKIIYVILAGLCVGSGQVYAESAGETPHSHLFDENIDFDVGYKGDIIATTSGGNRRGTTYLDNLDLKLTVNAEGLWGWNGVTLFLHGLSNHGGKPNAHYAGTAQGIDNIEVTTNTSKLYQAWIQKSLLNDRVSLLAGLYDLNSEFYVTDTSAVFLHPSPGIGSEFAQTGQNGPSIFPTTSAAFRVKAQPTSDYYLQAAVFDGVPGDPNNPKGTHIQFNSGDGALLIVEAAYLRGDHSQAFLSDRDRDNKTLEPFGKYAVGVWHYTAKFDDLLDTDDEGNPVRRGKNSGVYFLAEQSIYREADDSTQGVNAFARYGVANSDINRFAHYLHLGAVYTGLIPGRDSDQIGFSLGVAHNGSKYRETQLNEGAVTDHDEIGLELTYRAQVTHWLAIQPDIQYVINPDTNPDLQNATIVGIRFEVSLEQ